MKNLVGIAELTREQITELLDAAQAYRDGGNRPADSAPLSGRTVVNLFLEPSTRTRVSFETAAQRLGADVVNVGASGSSVVKGESLADTLYTVRAMGPDAIVLRHSASGAAMYASAHVDCAVINGGDGRHGHPTQALLDALTIRQHKGSLEGLRIVIVGDVLHSRVARSDILAFTALGAEVVLAGPRSLVPTAFLHMGAHIAPTLEKGLEGADVVMALRVQAERMDESFFSGNDEYHRFFGINEQRLALAKDDAILMHPGPMNRGVEIAGSVADGRQSVITEQVANGVAVRMAVLSRAVRAS